MELTREGRLHSYDGKMPFQRFPAYLSSQPIISLVGPNPGLVHRLLKECHAVHLRQWPDLQTIADRAISEAISPAAAPAPADCCVKSLGTSHPVQQASTHQPPVLQPWAVPGVSQKHQAPGDSRDASGKGAEVPGSATEPSVYGDVTFSGRLGRAGRSAERKGKPSPPLTVACARLPFQRFVRVDGTKVEATPPMYAVHQHEWRTLCLTGGLPELVQCLRAWASTRVLATLHLGQLHAPMAHTQGGGGRSQPWQVVVDLSTKAVFDHSSGMESAAGLEGVLQRLAAWVPSALLASPLAALLADFSPIDQQVPAWGLAEVELRWWSEGAVEPLRASITDRLFVQVQGSMRVLLVPPEFSLNGLAPFPSAHPYQGYSAPGLAVSSRPAVPSRRPAAHEMDSSLSGGPGPAYLAEEEAMTQSVLQLWPEFGRVCGQVCVLEPGDGLWVPAGWFVHLESLYTQTQVAPTGKGPPAAPPVLSFASECPTSTTSTSTSTNTSTNTSTSTRTHTSTISTTSTSATSSTTTTRHGPQLDGACDASPGIGPTEPLPGCISLELMLHAAGVGTAPRALGALEGAQAAQLIEGWAQAAGGGARRTRETLLDLADRLQAAAVGVPVEALTGAATGSAARAVARGVGQTAGSVVAEPMAGVSAGNASGSLVGQAVEAGAPAATGTAVERLTGTPVAAPTRTGAREHPSRTTDSLPGHDRSSNKGWVTFPGPSNGTCSSGNPGSAAALAAFAGPSHWAVVPNVSGPICLLTGGGETGSGAGVSEVSGRAAWPTTWDSSTLGGSRQVQLGQRVLALVAPMAALAALGQPSCVSVDSGASPVWRVGSYAAGLLRAMCQGRLLPTPWLDRLAHNELLVLADKTYTFTVELNSEEARWPQLFKPQLARRERRSKKAAEALHLEGLRRLRGTGTEALHLGPLEELRGGTDFVPIDCSPSV